MSESLLEFPCEFPLKVVGTKSAALRPAVDAALAELSIEVVDISERPSRGGNYVSLTLNVVPQSREQLDRLYARLTSLEDVRWVL